MKPLDTSHHNYCSLLVQARPNMGLLASCFSSCLAQGSQWAGKWWIFVDSCCTIPVNINQISISFLASCSAFTRTFKPHFGIASCFILARLCICRNEWELWSCPLFELNLNLVPPLLLKGLGVGLKRKHFQICRGSAIFAAKVHAHSNSNSNVAIRENYFQTSKTQFYWYLYNYCWWFVK